MKKAFVSSFFCLVLLGSCSSPEKGKTHLTDSLTAIDSLLSDDNFVYKNLSNTFGLDKNFKYDNEKLYADSTHKVAFVSLTPEQKLKIISPFISKELNVNDRYAVDLMQSYFIAKQSKVGDFQPIIVSITGDDYVSLTIIILDKNNRYVDGYNINGGMQPGPEEIGDSITKFELRSYSVLDKNHVTTIKINEADFHDSIKRKPSIIDSTVFKTTIEPSGKFKTIQSFKSQYKIPYS